MNDNEPVELSVGEAIAMLPEGEVIHTFRNPSAGMMLGCDWGREAIIKAITETDHRQLTGPVATSTGHGLAINESGRILFIATRTHIPAEAQS
jgi:hypothetical protein